MNRLKILIVDDEPITRLDLKEMLEENGYMVVGEGRNGHEAIEKAYELKPDLVIMDVKMPEMNGVKAASIIKTFSNCAILLLTAFSYRELIEDAKKASINAYLVKPVKERELLPAVEIALSQREQYLALKEKVRKTEQKMIERKMIEKAKGLLMSQLDCSEEEAYRQMRQTSMSSQIPLVKLAENILNKNK